MRCSQCLDGRHARVEVGVLVADAVTLRRYVCECGNCTTPCGTREVEVETPQRWRGQHRFREGAIASATALCAAAAAEAADRDAGGSHRAVADGRVPTARVAEAGGARAAVRAADRPGRHRAPPVIFPSTTYGGLESTRKECEVSQ